MQNKTRIYLNEGHISNRKSFIKDLEQILADRKEEENKNESRNGLLSKM